MKPDSKKIKEMEKEDEYLLDEEELEKTDRKFKRMTNKLSKLITKKKISKPVLKRVQSNRKSRIKLLKKKR
ncbi:hypothetical protein HN587_05230 [Candidatus Woesearchaeota archaeon]|jgi:hypothetical protein|nr:hypothetical protein [Candidatus Woesearchaeota archaeon]